MTAVQTLSLVLLAAVLVLAIWRKSNIGVLALGAAFVIVEVSGTDPDAVYEKFPGELVILIAGVSLLFGHLERSGALGWLVERIYQAVGSKTYLIPWATFAVAAALSSSGAFSTAVIALLVPMVAHISVRDRATFLTTELAAVIGANCAGLSPLNPTGALIKTVADKSHAHYSTWGVWAVSVAVAAVAVAVLQAIQLVQTRRGRGYAVTPAPAADDDIVDVPPNRTYAIGSFLALLVFVFLVVVIKTDVGMTAMALVVVLQFVFRPDEGALLRKVPWNAILLLTGLLTYLGVMQIVGTMKSIQHGLDHIGSPALLVLVLAYMTVLLCNIESSTLGVLGLMMPIAMGSFGDSSALFWVIAAMAVPAALMVMNPIHVAGTLIVGHSAGAEQNRLFRRLLGIAVSFGVVVPGLLAIVPMTLV